LIPKNILITGASGLIGTRLTTLLIEKGYHVAHLGRTKRNGPIPSFEWDINVGYMEGEALADTECVIHLAGAGIADKPWTPARKQEILESRVKSTALLRDSLQRYPNKVNTVIAASAIGYYGFGLSDEPLTEESPPGNDFLAQVVRAWEHEVDQLSKPGTRVVKIRVGIVLSDQGGALKELMLPIKWYAGAPLGTGGQQMSWIHIDDLCRIFIHAIENNTMHGAYNGTGPNSVTNREFTVAVANALKKPLWLPPIPAFAMKWILGEMADLILYGSNVSSEKIQQAGFSHSFQTIESALADLLVKK
jgi:uncharacterized protein